MIEMLCWGVCGMAVALLGEDKQGFHCLKREHSVRNILGKNDAEGLSAWSSGSPSKQEQVQGSAPGPEQSSLSI